MDITESKNKEENIIKSRDYSNNILNQIPSLVWKTNKDLEFSYVNKAWRDFTGITLEEITYSSWLKVIHPEDIDKYQKPEACNENFRKLSIRITFTPL